MNAQRRKDIDRIIEMLESAKSEIEQVASEEREYYDAMPEGIQAGEKGDRADEVASDLEAMDSDIQDVIDRLQDACS